METRPSPVVGGKEGGGGWEEEWLEMTSASIASLLQMPQTEVRRLLPQRSFTQAEGSRAWSECSGTSGYGSLLSPTSPPPRKDSADSATAPPTPSPAKARPVATARPAKTTAAAGECRGEAERPGQGKSSEGLAGEELGEVGLEMARALAAHRESRVPKPGYLCRICFAPGHLIFDCPAKHLTQCATPYKGPKQCYGEFACAGCRRKWRSGKSFADQGQACQGCRRLVFPHRQYSLERAVREGRWPPAKLPDPLL